MPKAGARPLALLAPLAALLLASAPAAQTPQRFATRHLFTGQKEEVVALADFTGEGDLDLVATSLGSYTRLWKGDGGGHFCPPTPVAAMSGYAEDLLGADVDLDGDVDLLAAGNGLRLAKNMGSAVFANAIGYGLDGRRLALGDLDGDGLPDAALSDYGGGTGARTWMNSGGGFTGLALGPWNAGITSGVALADLDGDGNLDLVTLDVYDGLRWAQGDGTGDFSATTVQGPSFPNGDNWWDLALDDLDGDGDTDAVVVGGPTEKVLVVQNLGGTLGAPVSLVASGVQQSVVLADLDGDGDRDIVAGSVSFGHLSLFHNTAGSFGSVVPVPSPVGVFDLACGDVDGDGDPDLVAPGFYSTNLALHLGDGVGGFDSFDFTYTGAQHTSVVTGDLDGNGWSDAVATAPWTLPLAVCLGGPSGLAAPSTPAVPFGNDARAVLLPDLDGDSDQDIVHASFAGVQFHAGDGAGGFAAPLVTPAGPSPIDLAAGDLDNDGDLDLVTAQDTGSHGAGTLLNTGGGALGAWSSQGTGYDALALDLGDLDGDGLLDGILATNAPGVGLLTLHGNGAGGQVAWNFTPTGAPNDVALADLTNDGLLDALEVEVGTNQLRVHPGLGNGAFGAPIVRPVPLQPVSVHTADIDNDTLPDAVVSCNGGQSVAVVLSNGIGSLGPAEVYAAGQYPTVFTTDDMDLDGRTDVVVAGNAGQGLAVLHGQFPLQGLIVGLGNGLAGIVGVPNLSATGSLAPGSFVNLELHGGLNDSPAWLIMSPCFANLPFKSGVMVPDPSPPASLTPLMTGPLGHIGLFTTWPSGIPSGFNLYAQYWIADGAAPQGWSASNGLRLCTP